MKKRYPFLSKNWLCFGLLVVCATSFSLGLHAQTGSAKLWDKTFGGASNDRVNIIQQTFDGGYILGGDSDSGIGGDKTQPARGLYDFWVIKLDANGNKIWDKTFGGSLTDRLNSLQQTADGGYILGGYSESGISGDKTQSSKGDIDYWVIKLDASGNKLWDKTLGGSSEEELKSLVQTSDGGYILGGWSNSPISGDKTAASYSYPDQFGNMIPSYDYWVVKLDVNGNKIWDKCYGGIGADKLFSLQQTSDGGYILGGESNSDINGDKSQTSRGNSDFWLVKLDTSGNKLWDKTVGGSGYENLRGLVQTLDGGYIAGGTTSNSGISGDITQLPCGYYDYWVVKVDSNGNKLWDKSFGGSSIEMFTSLAKTSDGGCILGGFSYSDITCDKTQQSKGHYDYWIVKLNASGNKHWDNTIGGSNLDHLNSLVQTSDGNYVLGGTSQSSISADKTQASQGGDDYWIVKLEADSTSNPVGIKEPETSFAVSISPNPNQGKFTLQLGNLTAPKTEVTVSDLLGRVILQQSFNVNNKQISEDVNLLNAKGMFLLQVKVGEQLITRKIVVE